MSHIDSFNNFLKDFNDASKCILPETPRRYEVVSVLLIRWEDDDLGTESEINELDDIFRKMYNFKTTRFLIPSVNPSYSLEDRLSTWRMTEDNKGQNLLIIYYGGHARLGMEWRPPYSSVWAAKRDANTPTLNWTVLQPYLHRALSDVVFILDCCHEAVPSLAAGAKEGLWAMNSLATTPRVSDNSFTRHLIHVLKDLHQTRFNTVILHQHLMLRYGRRDTPRLQTEPWYSFLGSEMSPSAELTAANPNLIMDQTISLPRSETLVLLGVRTKDVHATPDAASWGNWLRDNAPDEVGSVVALCKRKIVDIIGLQGIFRSDPGTSLVLITIPLCLWDRLPRSEAYHFISYVTSTNLVKGND